jgi:hypothetical protein
MLLTPGLALEAVLVLLLMLVLTLHCCQGCTTADVASSICATVAFEIAESFKER